MLSYLRKTRAAVFIGLLALAATCPAADKPAEAKPREFKPSRTLGLEAQTLVKLLEEVHYNRSAVKVQNYDEVVQKYMESLDGQRLYFAQADKDAFQKRYSAEFIYWNLSGLGRMDAAFKIFAVYEKSVRSRAEWIGKRLDQPFDLTTDGIYEFDRSEAPWPADAAELDELWEKRLKLEIIKELLNKKTMEDAVSNVRKRYDRMVKNLLDIEMSDVVEIFLGTIARLYDPHSSYFSPETFEDFSINIRLQLVGIGAVLSMEDDMCVIKEIVPGGPADLDKRLKPNDKIVAVSQEKTDPVDVIGMKLRKVVKMIRGTKGTKVFLTVEPADNPSAHKVIDITRDVVNLDSARAYGAVFQVPGTDGDGLSLGVITLPSFYGASGAPSELPENSTSKDVAELIKRLREKNVQGIVLDLRRNGGGLLNEAINLTGLFIKQGPVVQVRNSIGGVKVESDEDDSVAYDGPLVVLTSRFSASASEIVAGALQNYGRALVIGDNSTHGKGSVQTIIELKNMVPQLAQSREKIGATKLTVQKFYLPNGSSTQLKGVVPDIQLPSANEFIPIGESDLPHALPWDEIPSSIFHGKPLPAEVLIPLRAGTQERLRTLPEFDYLKRTVEVFKKRQDDKTLALNLEKRREQQASDRAQRNAFNLERKELTALDYAYEEVLLAKPKETAGKADKSDDDEDGEDEDNYKELFPDENERFPYMDIPLREALRVLQDWIGLSSEKTVIPVANK